MFNSKAFASGIRLTVGVGGSCELNCLFRYDDVDVAGLATAISYGGGGGNSPRLEYCIGLPPTFGPYEWPAAVAGEMGDISDRMACCMGFKFIPGGPGKFIIFGIGIGVTDDGRDREFGVSIPPDEDGGKFIICCGCVDCCCC